MKGGDLINGVLQHFSISHELLQYSERPGRRDNGHQILVRYLLLDKLL
jgi:hypothetical protein